ncbi:HAMP domain-containing protein,histidine kinase [Synechococcus sp. PCC 7502]|uniref:ATP-binding SpoIIE family protein phosphatase n=1 Tax=Synechococcus sp. PCC 7502 TaxID=1173263 RepID=UPI00029F9530|nr:SpoIIE family protein phosphatase [Synechococcus sp. PCC 7502]AFY74705.1 HAMP domain-containing protein,histidine kinase [Synechococcus sp. PCC 7502]
MTKFTFPSFQFKSITYRLIFGCVVAAIAIYGLSYTSARLIIQSVVEKWMLDIAQSRIDTITKEIEGELKAIEHSTLILSQIKSNNDLRQSLKVLADNQPKVQAIALINTNNINNLGWQYQRQKGYTKLNEQEQLLWQNQCLFNKKEEHKLQPHWTAPHPLLNSQLSGVTYCVPITSGILAMEVNLDWITPLMQKYLTQPDEVNFLKLGETFVISPSNQWIVKPTTQIQNKTQNDLFKQISQQVPSVNWKVGVAFSNSELERFLQHYLWLAIASMSRDMVLMWVVIAMISRLTTRSLRALIDSTEAMAHGDLDTKLPPVTSVDEVGRLTQAFGRMQSSLLTHIQDLQETTAAKQKLESEITLAAEIQRTMLPRPSILGIPNAPYEISALLKPARIVGGDLYDFFLLGSDRLCLIIGDVAGKGFPAALMMACTVTLIRALTKTSSTPAEILHNVNRELCVDNNECQFVTLFCGVLDLHSGRFIYASAGHDAPLLIKNQQVTCLDLDTGSPLGLYEDAIFTQSECLLESNDLILLYTDGITEAMNSKGEIFTDERLIETIKFHLPSNPTRTIRTVQHFCDRFVGEAPQSDDMTLLVLQYLPLHPLLQENIMEWSLSINSELTDIEKLRQNLSQILAAAALTMESIEDAQLIAEEVVVNIIQYGYANSQGGHIDLQLELDAERLTMTFIDGGKPFNPITEIAAPDLNGDDDRRSQGGLGFFLVQQLSEKVNYIHENGKNILTVCQLIAKIP